MKCNATEHACSCAFVPAAVFQPTLDSSELYRCHHIIQTDPGNPHVDKTQVKAQPCSGAPCKQPTLRWGGGTGLLPGRPREDPGRGTRARGRNVGGGVSHQPRFGPAGRPAEASPPPTPRSPLWPSPPAPPKALSSSVGRSKIGRPKIGRLLCAQVKTVQPLPSLLPPLLLHHCADC